MKIDRKMKSKLKAHLLKKIKEEERAFVSIETPYKLSKEGEKAFLKKFPEYLKLDCNFLVNQDLIGGYLIRHASYIIDASVATRLNNIVEKMIN